MEKEIAIGNTVERLQEQYSCFNPSTYLKTLSLNVKDKEKKIISKILGIDSKLQLKLVSLYRNMLCFRRGNVVLDIQDIISLLHIEYKPLIESLNSEKTDYAKTLFNDWKLEWMLSYIKDSIFLEDLDFFEQYGLDIDEEIENKVKGMRLEYFTEEELMEIFGDEYFVEC
jgi:hypothetical protein